MQLFLFLFPLQHIKRPALQNKQVVVLRMAFRDRKVLGTFEKRAPGFTPQRGKKQQTQSQPPPLKKVKKVARVKSFNKTQCDFY